MLGFEQLEELERELAEEIRCRRRAEKRLKHALKKLESLKLAKERSCSSSQCSATVNSGQCGPSEEVEGMAGDEGRCSLVGTVQDHVEDEPEFRSQESSTDASRYVCLQLICLLSQIIVFFFVMITHKIITLSPILLTQNKKDLQHGLYN